MVASYKLFIFDADGTLRRCTISGQPCPNAPGEWELLPGVKERLARFNWEKLALGIASNQAGVALGYLSEKMAFQLLCDMVVEATGFFPPAGSVRLCPHQPSGPNEENCGCRKPEPGMLKHLMMNWDVMPKETLFVGDMESDKLASIQAGCDFLWAWEFFGWEQPV